MDRSMDVYTAPSADWNRWAVPSHVIDAVQCQSCMPAAGFFLTKYVKIQRMPVSNIFHIVAQSMPTLAWGRICKDSAYPLNT